MTFCSNMETLKGGWRKSQLNLENGICGVCETIPTYFVWKSEVRMLSQIKGIILKLILEISTWYVNWIHLAHYKEF